MCPTEHVLPDQLVSTHRELDRQGPARVAEPHRVELLVVEPLALVLEPLAPDLKREATRDRSNPDERLLDRQRDVFARLGSIGLGLQHELTRDHQVQKRLEPRLRVEGERHGQLRREQGPVVVAAVVQVEVLPIVVVELELGAEGEERGETVPGLGRLVGIEDVGGRRAGGRAARARSSGQQECQERRETGADAAPDEMARHRRIAPTRRCDGRTSAATPMTSHECIMLEEPVSNRARFDGGVQGQPSPPWFAARSWSWLVLSSCASYVSRSLPVGSNVPSAARPLLQAPGSR